jgi:aspartokinase/homoserine dehydrogenase 1
VQAWKVHKFGGSSVADAACMERVARIIETDPAQRKAVVLSACRGVTDALLTLISLAEQDDASVDDRLQQLRQRHVDIARELLSGELHDDFVAGLERDLQDIAGILQTVRLVRSASATMRDLISGYGELWSTRIFERLLRRRAAGHVQWLDARKALLVEWGPMGPGVRWEQSRSQLAALVAPQFVGTLVVTGFIATDVHGLQTTLGRNGSDYSAAIFAALCDADELSIWTDVDGIMSADPNRVPEARVIEHMTYNEAMELAYFGAKVIHPQTLGPVIENEIPVIIRNSRNPAHPGSRIDGAPNSKDPIKGITAIGGMALVSVEGAGMIGVPGTAERLFRALHDAGVSVSLISQASSEHSICVAVPGFLAERARNVIADAFAEELDSSQIQKVDVSEAQSIVAVVGDGMAGTPGVAARFFGTLGRAGINIRAIAQGSSERNISAVVDSTDATRALRAAHSGFYLSAKTLSIGMIGPGSVGKTLLSQFEKQAARLERDFSLDLRVRAIARSKSMLLGERRIPLAGWERQFATDAVDIDLAAFEKHVNADHLPHAVIIDCTASAEIAARYAGWLERGINVITPNKKAFSGPLAAYRDLERQSEKGSAHYFYETTVGAALPIISTLRDLIDTGDEIRSVQGILSGTLAYLFNVYDGTTPFSQIVRKAKESGYTEPDPRDDLSGMDVARKLTILARELGQPLEIGDFPVQNLVPDALRECGIDEFLDRLPEYDGEIKALYERARAQDKNLRYVARLGIDGKAGVGLEAVERSHAFSHINLTDNIVQFESARYSDNPLVIQGPGAGPDVTAGGVFSDLLRLASYLSSGQGHG